jgi:MipA family protein
MKSHHIIAVSAVLALAPHSAQAEDAGDGWSGFIAAGPGAAPTYEGGRKYTIIPFVSGDLKYRSATFEFRGLGARLDVFSLFGNGAVYGGPAVQFRLPRDKDVGGPVALLDEVKFNAEGGGFIGVGFGGNQAGRGRIKLELSGYVGSKGLNGTALASYALVRTEKIFVDIDNSVSFANKKFMRTYFGVTPAEALRSGLEAYTPDASIKNIDTGITIGYQFNSRWGIVANGNYSYLIGDAGKSSLVKDKSLKVAGSGSRSQFIGGVGILYRF